MTIPDSAAGDDPVIARDGDGNDVVAWLQDTAAGPARVVASRRSRGGAFATSTLSADGNPPLGPPVLAGDPGGATTISWVARGGSPNQAQIDFVLLGADGFEPRQTLSTGVTGTELDSVDVAVTPAGETIFAWTQPILGATHARAIIRSSAGVLSAAATLSDAEGDAEDPQVAASAAGAIVTWLQKTVMTSGVNPETETTVTRVQAARRSADGFAAGATVGDATSTTVTTTDAQDNDTSVTTGQELDSPLPGADDLGGAVVAFLRTAVDEHDPELPGDTRTSVAHVATGPVGADGNLGAPAATSPTGQNAGMLSLTLARSGAGVLAWRVGPAVHATRRPSGGPFGTAALVTAVGEDPATAIRAGGTPIIAFSPAGQAMASVGLAGGGYEPAVPLSPGDPSSGDPSLAADGRGGAAATWSVDPLPLPAIGDESIRVVELQPDVGPPAPPPPPVAPLPPSPLAPLALTSFGVHPKCIRYGRPFTGRRKRLSFGFVLSEASWVRLTIQRRLNSGPLRHCPTKTVRGEPGVLGPPSVVDITAGGGAGAITVGDEGEATKRAGRKPTKTVVVTRRLASGHRRIVLQQAPKTLAPGTYVARLIAATADGRLSVRLKVKFWVLRRPQRH